MKRELTKNEVVDLLKEFANETGTWEHLKEFLQRQGYDLSEFGINDED